VIHFHPEVIPPIAGFGKQIGPQSFVVTPEDAAAMTNPSGILFDNATIFFPLDLITGADFVDNADNCKPMGSDRVFS